MSLLKFSFAILTALSFSIANATGESSVALDKQFTLAAFNLSVISATSKYFGRISPNSKLEVTQVEEHNKTDDDEAVARTTYYATSTYKNRDAQCVDQTLILAVVTVAGDIESVSAQIDDGSPYGCE